MTRIYSESSAKSFRGQSRRRMETLDGLRQGLFVQHLKATGKDDDMAKRFGDLLKVYAHLIEAERRLYRHLFPDTDSKTEDTPHE